MIGSFIAGAIGALLLGSRPRATRGKVVVEQGPNPLIEYHRWLERKKRREDYMKACEQEARRRHERSHCSICGKGITCESKLFRSADSYDDAVLVRVVCGCDELADTFTDRIAVNLDRLDASEKVSAAARRLYLGHKEYEKTVEVK